MADPVHDGEDSNSGSGFELFHAARASSSGKKVRRLPQPRKGSFKQLQVSFNFGQLGRIGPNSNPG